MRGLFYAGNGLLAEDLTLVGALVAGRTASEVSLVRAPVVAEPVSTPSLERVYYVGTVTTINPGGQADPFSVLPTITTERPPLGSAFRMRLETSSGGGYPLVIELLGGDALPRTGRGNDDSNFYDAEAEDRRNLRFTINDANDIPTVQGYYEQEFDTSVAWLSSFFVQNPIDNLVQDLVEESEDQVDIVGDLSRLIPVKDRIRVTSWFE